MTVIGIDLGTTNSACGIWQDGDVVLIPNRFGDLLTPSVVGLDDTGEMITGSVAKQRLITHAKQTVAVFKRLMGTEHKVQLNKQVFSAVELSALVLRCLKEDAEAYLGEMVTEAVISVPAYFNDNQRHATKTAGELAGLKVRRLINEPTAAALAYGLQDKREGTFIILDMGGGTFDVSILEFFDGIMEVHASAGDNFLGGEDFVEAMIKTCLSDLSHTQVLSAMEQQRLYMQMETAKRRTTPTMPQELEIVLQGKTHQFQVTDGWLSKTIAPLLRRVKKPIGQALSDANLKLENIDDIILVGGTTKQKHFKDEMARLFRRFPSCTIDPDIVVCRGAAIQAGLVQKDEALDDIVLTDVCPYTLGTGVAGHTPDGENHYLPIIERNTVVPISIVSRVVTSYENQKEVRIAIYQGENRLVSKNVYLGELTAKVPPGPQGKEAIDVRFSYDMNGLLEVDITVVSNGFTQNKVIENSPGNITPEALERSREKLAALKFHPRDHEENRLVCARAERLYESGLGSIREEITYILSEFELALESQNLSVISKARQKTEKLLDQFDNEDWF